MTNLVKMTICGKHSLKRMELVNARTSPSMFTGAHHMVTTYGMTVALTVLYDDVLVSDSRIYLSCGDQEKKLE